MPEETLEEVDFDSTDIDPGVEHVSRTIVTSRNFNPGCTKYQSDNPGAVIKSDRKFGIELELVSVYKDGLKKLAEKADKSFGLGRDGSIMPPAGGFGIELVSPIMKGAAGEDVIKDLLPAARSFGFSTNTSCGLHVHLSGDGFAEKEDNMKVVSVSSATEDILEQKYTRDDRMFVMSSDLMKTLVGFTGASKQKIARIVLDEIISFGSRESVYRISLNKAFGETLPEILCYRCETVIGKYSLRVTYAQLVDRIKMPTSSSSIDLGMDTLDIKPNDLLCLYKNTKSLEHTKALLYAYTVLTDVFTAMLPVSRRNNVYCQSLALSFSPNSIESIKTYSELEAAWYRARDIKEVSRSKGSHYDDSRYYGINLHSLFTKYGTVEIRSHAATLDPNKVIFWVALHQKMLDMIASGAVTINAMRALNYCTTVQEKVDMFCNVFSLGSALTKYVNKRIQFFNNNIK